MSFDTINIGIVPNDGTGDTLRSGGEKINDNFAKAVEGPASSTNNRVAVFDGTTGKLLKDGTKVEADLVTGPAAATSGRVAVFDGTTGKLLQDGTKLEDDLVVGPASATDGRVAVYDQTTGKLLKDGTKLEADLVVGPASATAAAVAAFDGTTGKLIQNGQSLAVTAGKFVPTESTVAGNGMYLPASDEVAISTGGTQRLRIAADSFISQPVISHETDTGSVSTAHDRVVIASTDSTASSTRSAVIASSADSLASANRSVVISSNVCTASGARSAVVSSANSTASGSLSAVVASEDSTASAITSAVVASADSTAGGSRSAVVASEDSTASVSRSAVVASTQGTASGDRSAVVASGLCETESTRAVVVSSRRVVNSTSFSLALGDGSAGSASTANRKIHLFGSNGNVSIAGTLTQNATFTDFAEMMPNATGAEIEPGVLLTMVDGAVQPANAGDEVCGVVSHTAAVLAGDTPFSWQGRYMHDEFGRRLYEDVPDEDWEPNEGQTEADRPTITALKQNPEWNPDLPQVPRSERPDQWTPVGLIGQVFVRVTKDVKPGDRIAAGTEGVGVSSVDRTGVRCMTITTPYDAKRGYAIARCLINVQV